METEKKEPCYVLNHNAKSIEMSFEYEGNKIEVKQRRLSGKETDRHKSDLKNVYTHPDIYKTMLLQNELDKKIERAKKKRKDDKEPLDVPVDDETKYQLYKGRIAIEKSNREVEARFIAYSCEESVLHESGYFRINGKEVDFETRVQAILELTPEDKTGKDYFKILLGNANKLTYPTQHEIETAKS